MLDVGANHAAAIRSQGNELYVWGHNNCQQLGIKLEDEKKALEKPMYVDDINELLITNQKLNEGQTASKQMLLKQQD